MIFGIGTDIIKVDRFEKMVAKGRKNLKTIFTEREMDYCESKTRRSEHYAARFAAKEAVLKALGIGWRDGFAFSDIEILNDNLGKPEVFLHGKVKNYFKTQKIKQIKIYMSHSKENAIAFAILEK
jgi:holo-[acyl-carrier protein] synthase